jgi:hypothetical protein
MQASEASAVKREGITHYCGELAFPPAGKEIVGSSSGAQA